MAYTLITGASSGIGLATARLLAQQGQNLLLVARRKDRLESLQKELGPKCEVHIAALDITSAESTKKLTTVFKNLDKVETLINNAGLAKGMNPLQEGAIEDWDVMLQTNVMGLLRMSRLILPHMLKNKTGHIINIGSVAGKWAYPKGNVYCASKAAVHMLTETLRMDLLGSGIRVTEICPGMVETEFSEVRLGNKESAKAVYQGLKPLSAEDVAETIVWSMSRPAHVNVQEIVLYPTAQASVRDTART